MSALTTASAVGVNEYQTVCGEEAQGCGSPGSVVAVVLSTESLNGNAVMTVGAAKLSFGGIARAVPAKRPRSDTPRVTTVMGKLNVFKIRLTVMALSFQMVLFINFFSRFAYKPETSRIEVIVSLSDLVLLPRLRITQFT